VRFMLTADQTTSIAPDRGLPAEVVMADTTFDADHLWEAITARERLTSFPTIVTCDQISARQESFIKLK
jgi:hypothetical protein